MEILNWDHILESKKDLILKTDIDIEYMRKEISSEKKLVKRK